MIFKYNQFNMNLSNRKYILKNKHVNWHIKFSEGAFTIYFAYRIVASSSPSRIEAHAGLFRLLMKGIFDPYVLWPFDKKLIF